MASYSNRWAPRRTSKPPKPSIGTARLVVTLAVAGLGALLVQRLVSGIKPPSTPLVPPSSAPGVLPLGTSGRTI